MAFKQSFNTTEQWLKFSDGLEYYSKTWVPINTPIATVLFIHGLGEHVNRYNHVFNKFAEANIKVFAFDQRGFGQTCKRNGIPGHNSGLDRVLLDISEAQANIKTNTLPHFLMGHSMGGGLSLKYATCFPSAADELTGLIASAPLVQTGSKTTPSTIEYWAMRGLSNILKTVVTPNPVDVKQLSRDPTVATEYTDDPYVHCLGSIQTLVTIVLMGEDLLKNDYKNMKMPLLITHGTNDTQTSPEGSKKFYDIAYSSDKSYVDFPGCYHELHNELAEDRAKVISTYIKWIIAHSS